MSLARPFASIAIKLEADSKFGRALVDQLIAAIDEPRLHVTRARNGSAELTFNSDAPHSVPYIQGAAHGEHVFKLSTRDGNTRLTIDCAQRETILPVVIVDNSQSLPTIRTDALGGALVVAAFDKLGLTWAELVPTAEQRAAEEARAARARALMEQRTAETPEQRQEREDRELADSEPYFSSSDSFGFSSPNSPAVLSARGRIATRAEAKLKAEQKQAETVRRREYLKKLAALGSATEWELAELESA
jgi:hypothetical protein